MGLPALYATYNSSHSNHTVSSVEGKKAASCVGNYQDAAMASLNHNFDNDAATQNDSETDYASPDQSGSILLLVEKVQPY